MPVFVMIALVIFIANIMWLARRYTINLQRLVQTKVAKIEDTYNKVMAQREKILNEIKMLESEASEIFTLYEISKEITQRSSEEEAFEVFRQKLQETIDVNDCRFLGVDEDIESIRKNPENFIFTLKEKRKKLGYIVFGNVDEEKREKITILSHQFALALRRVKLYEEVEELAITDSLTKTHTRRYFLQRFEEELERSSVRGTSLGLLMIDVDHFKSYNDKYGHLAGDQILKEITSIIKANIREIDVVGRYGGEEFCVALPDTDIKGIMQAAERIRSAAEQQTIKAYDTQAKVTISIGAAVFPSDGKRMVELIDKADWALYRAKKKGRNCTCAFGIYEEQ